MMKYIKIPLVILFTFDVIIHTESAWTTPPYRAPNPLDPAVVFDGYETATRRTIVHLEEEVNHEVCIAELNNYNDLTEPKLGKFDKGDNYLLGAIIKKTNDVWKICITNRQDYERPDMRLYIFSIGSGTDSYEIDLYIKNIDDNAPVIQPNQQKCAVNENYQGPTNCSFIVTDADGWINKIKLSYSTSSPDASEIFQFRTQLNTEYQLTAYLDLNKKLDFEMVAMYMLMMIVKDEHNNTGSLLTVIEVIDMPDEPPKWTHLIASETIQEKKSHTFNVTAIDGDIQINEEINYRIITEQSEINLFAINKNTGEIIINAIDRDTLRKEVFKFQVIAYEKNDVNSNINATITIIVEDINDHVPEIFPKKLEISIPEATYMTLDFQEPIVISDPDLAENAQYSVFLKNNSPFNWSSAFLIVPDAGYQNTTFTISVANASLLDYEDENWRQIEIQIEAVEVRDPTHIGQRTIKIDLENWNDELPIFKKNSVEVRIPEDVGANYTIATMLATDRDIDDVVTHSLVAQKTLSIDKQNGIIKTTINDSLDYESTPILVVQVVATDIANHTTYGTLTINVIDVNDVPPKLYLPQKFPSLTEEVKNNTIVNTFIYAIDPDTEADLIFSIDWDSTVAFKSSVLANQSEYREHMSITTKYPETHHGYAEGELVVSGRIDYEKLDVMYISIVVTDRATVHNDNSTNASLTLNIIDINDNAPVFQEIRAMKVSENQLFDTIIGTVVANDADGPFYNTVSYSIQPINGTENDLVDIDNKNGIIKVKKDKGIDAEKYEYLNYNITASDGENNDTVQVNIYVNDMNDEKPYFIYEKFNSTIHIREKSPNGTEIVTIVAKDNDRTSPYNNVSYLINSNYSAPLQYFNLSKFYGLLQVNLLNGHILDRDFGPISYALNIKIRDNYLNDDSIWDSNENETIITVILDDINDQIPKLPKLDNPAAEISQIKPESTFVISITADDKDDPKTDNTKVKYKILKSYSETNESKDTCDDPFEVKTINLQKADIFTKRNLRDCYGTWAIELYVEDLGSDPGSLNDTKTYYIDVTDYNYNSPRIDFPSVNQIITLSNNQNLNRPLKTCSDRVLSDFKALDDDDGASGTVTFNLTSNNKEHEYFKVVSTGRNTGQLRLQSMPDFAEQNTYDMNVTAIDQGTPSKYLSQEFSIKFVSHGGGPQFNQNEWTVWIKENIIDLPETIIIPPAHDVCEATDNPETYYFIDDKVGDHEFFELNKKTGQLSLIKKLDRETKDIMTVIIIATADINGPPRDPEKEAILNITVVVLDENDNPPIFESKLYSAGVARGDSIDNVVLNVHATDADINDTLVYFIVAGSLNVSDVSLNELQNPFSLNENTGELLLKFSPTNNMVGFFSFMVNAVDDVHHKDTTLVQIYIISQDNRVEFTFRNNASYILEKKLNIIEAFSKSFNYLCNIDDIRSSSAAYSRAVENRTILTTHFIDPNDHLPISADTIVLASSNLQTISNLKALLQTNFLQLIDVPTGSSTITNTAEQTIHWILVSLTILFSICTTALLAAYYIRTKSLLQRLNKMSGAWKFESQESGLDKVGIVPTSNQFSVSGSNPIWNTSKSVNNFGDNISRKSGDSDLIGVEDNPYFDSNYKNNIITAEKNFNSIMMGNESSNKPKFILNKINSNDNYSEEDKKC